MASEQIVNPVYVVLDVETTGLSEEDRVVQIACLKIDSQCAKTAWIRYINPCLPSEKQLDAYRIHKISPEFLLTKPTFKDIAKSFLEFLNDVDFILAHNCIFDWSMLWNELRLLQDGDYKPADEFLEKFKWLDVLRLAILRIPNQFSYKLDTLRGYLQINPETIVSELSGGDGREGDDGRDEWKQRRHDAMYDAIMTYQVLLYCMGQMNFRELVLKYPKALLDIRLFSDMQHLMEDKRTSTEDLLPFAHRAKEYYTTSRPKGRTLKTLSKDYLLRMTDYHREDPCTDRRIVLIYEAAYLDPPHAGQRVDALPTPAKDSPQNHTDASEANCPISNDKDTRENTGESVTQLSSNELPKKNVNEERGTTEGKYATEVKQEATSQSKEVSIKDKDDEDINEGTRPNDKDDPQSTPPKKMKIVE